MRSRRVLLLRETADVVRQLQRDPELGEPLECELTGLRRVRVGQLTIVYRVSTAGVEVVATGPRRSIYTALELPRALHTTSATTTASHSAPSA